MGFVFPLQKNSVGGECCGTAGEAAPCQSAGVSPGCTIPILCLVNTPWGAAGDVSNPWVATTHMGAPPGAPSAHIQPSPAVARLGQ